MNTNHPRKAPLRLLVAGAWAGTVLGAAPGPAARAQTPPAATALPTARPEEVGLSAERLPRIDAAIRRYLDEGKLAGAVTLVARRGRVVHFAAQGFMDVEARRPMRTDALFHMASATKPVTAVAILMLMEEGKLRLNDPVARFLPEFKDMKVTVPKVEAKAETRPANQGQGPEVDLVPAVRPITLRDLLTHTSGLGSGAASSQPIEKLLRERLPTDTLADFVAKVGALPLDFQPGTQFRYSGLAGFDTLARVVEVASGQTFEQFLSQRLFEPLGMRDTFFVVPDDRRPRLATIYRSTPKGLEKVPVPNWASSATYFSGAGGLTSSAEDYARFAQMLLNGGQLNGRRILSPRSVELMASNHVGTMFVGQLDRPAGMGFGLGVEVVEDAVRTGWRRSNGSFGWDGAFGTIFWVDPKEQIIAVLMVQRGGRDIYRDFENAIEQAIVE